MSESNLIDPSYVRRNANAQEACEQVVSFINDYEILKQTDWFRAMARRVSGDMTTPAIVEGIVREGYIMPEAKELLQTKEDLMIIDQNLKKLQAESLIKDGNVKFQMQGKEYRLTKERSGEIFILEMKGDQLIKRISFFDYMKVKLSNLNKMKDLRFITKCCNQLSMLTIDNNCLKDKLRFNSQLLDDLNAKFNKEEKRVGVLSSRIVKTDGTLLKYKCTVLILSILLTCSGGFTL